MSIGKNVTAKTFLPDRRSVLAGLAGFFGISTCPAIGFSAEASDANVLEPAGIEILPDGSLALRNGQEVVLAGLDVALGLAPATAFYSVQITALAERRPWRVLAALPDRYGRLAGRVEAADGTWIQEHLLRLGLARFAGGLADPAASAVLLQAERAARAEGLGVWRDPRFILRHANMPDEIYDGFRIVEGSVAAVGRGDGVVYLNFGADWREDFTAGITARFSPRILTHDESAGSAAEIPDTVFGLAGYHLRLRGVVRRYNGPYMEIASADQIELIGAGGIGPVSFDPSSADAIKPDAIRPRSSGPSGLQPVSGSTL